MFIKKYTTYLLLIILFNSCTFKPYESQLYKNINSPQITNYSIRTSGELPNIETFDSNYINNAFINVEIGTEDWGGYNRRGPYRIIVTIFSDQKFSVAKINNIKIVSLNNMNKYEFNSDQFPLDFYYDGRQPGYSKLPKSINEGEYRSGADYRFKFKDKEKISIEVNITLTSDDKSETKIIECSFKPYSSRGFFQFIM